MKIIVLISEVSLFQGDCEAICIYVSWGLSEEILINQVSVFLRFSLRERFHCVPIASLPCMRAWERGLLYLLYHPVYLT